MSTRWSAKSLLVVGLGITVAVSLQSEPAEGGQQQNAQVERGKYLVGITGCHDCHSPKLNAALEPDMARALSGRPATTPVCQIFQTSPASAIASTATAMMRA